MKSIGSTFVLMSSKQRHVFNGVSFQVIFIFDLWFSCQCTLIDASQIGEEFHKMMSNSVEGIIDNHSSNYNGSLKIYWFQKEKHNHICVQFAKKNWQPRVIWGVISNQFMKKRSLSSVISVKTHLHQVRAWMDTFHQFMRGLKEKQNYIHVQFVGKMWQARVIWKSMWHRFMKRKDPLNVNFVWIHFSTNQIW